MAGEGEITSPSHHILQVKTSDKAIIDWRTFNIDKNEETRFLQPSKNSITLNQINPQNGVSSILGKLSANGQIWLSNPAGILFGPQSQVNVASLLATTASISKQDFLSGHYHFIQSPDWHGSVINQGEISIADKGLAALVAPNVENRGVIYANFAKVILAGTNEYTIDLYGDQLIQFGLNSKVTDKSAGVKNSGKIIANGGKVLLAAQTASQLIDNAIDMDGYIEAKSAVDYGGTIVLIGGDENRVKISGKMIASGREPGEKGGKIHLSGKEVWVLEPAILDVAGDAGGGEILIGGDSRGLGLFPHAGKTISMPNTYFLADAIKSGDGGKIILYSKDATFASGHFRAKGGTHSGNGGFVEVSGNSINVDSIQELDLRAPKGKWGTLLIDPSNININNNATASMTFLANLYTPSVIGAGTATLNAGDLGTRLSTANVTVSTLNVLGTGSGDIVLNDAANQLQTNWGSANTILTLQADRNTTISSNISVSGTSKGITISPALTNLTGTVALNGTLDGSLALIITLPALSTGTVTLGAILGSTTPLNSVAITGATNLNANVTTTGAQTYNSAVTVGATSTVQGGTISFQGISLGANTLTINTSAANSAIAGVASGTGALTKAGSGTLTLNSANTYGGTTTVSAGTLKNGVANALPTATALSVSGTYDANGFAQTVGSVTGNGTVTNSSGTGITFTVNNSTTDSFSGNLTSNLGLTKTNNGTLILSGSNTYTGATAISAGTVSLASATSLGSSSGTTVTSGAALDVNFNSATLGNTNAITINGDGISSAGALTFTGTSATLNNTITLGSNSTLGGSGSGILANTVSGSFNLTKTGASTITLSGSNTYSGSTSINAGTLKLGSTTGLGNTTGTSVTNGGALDINFNSATLGNTNSITLNGDGISSAGALTFTGTNATLNNGITLGSNSAIGGAGSGTLSNILSGSFNLIKAGASAITLSGTNTYSGGTNINSGTLNITTSPAALGTGNVSVSSGTTLNIINSLGSAITNAFTLSGTGVSNNGALTTTGTNTLSGTINLAGNTSMAVSNSNDELSLTGVISGANSLTKIGSGLLSLSNSNSYSGGTNINSGTINISNSASALGTGNTIVASGAALNIINSIGGVITNTFSLNGNGSGSGVLINAGTNTLSGNITLSGNTTVNSVNSSDSLSLTGSISGANNLTKTGSGIMILSGNNTYSGTTTISAGTLGISNIDGLGNTTGISVNAGGILDISFNNTTLTNNSDITLNNGSLTFTGTGNTFNNNIILASDSALGGTNSATLAGSISGGFRLTKIGSGTITLTNANTYSGGTTINAGTINISNSGTALGTGNVNVASGTTLKIINTLSSAISNQITLSGSGVDGNGALVDPGINTITGDIILANDTTIGVTDSDTLILSGIVSGAYNLIKTGTGTLVLSGVNTYSGETQINEGILSIANTFGLGDTSQTSVTSGSTLEINFNNATLGNTNPIIINGTGSNNNGALFGNGSNIILNNLITLGSDSSIHSNGVMLLNTLFNTPYNLTFNYTHSGIQLPSITLTNNANLSVTTQGDITQSDSLDVSGSSSFNAGNGAILLNDDDNDLVGPVTLLNTGSNDAYLRNDTDILLATSSIGRNLSLVANGLITQTGTLNASSLTVTARDGVALTNNNTINGFNATNNVAGNISLTNTAPLLTITGITQKGNGNVTITNTGAMKTTGLIKTSGGDVNLTTLSNNNQPQTLTINGGISTFGGSITASATNPTRSQSVLIVNSTLDTTGDSGFGTLTIGYGVQLNTAPILGKGNITLQTNGFKFTLIDLTNHIFPPFVFKNKVNLLPKKKFILIGEDG